MTIAAVVVNRGNEHRAVVRTGDKEQPLAIAAKAEGSGSSVNGGELLFLALATCFCNDLYREANERELQIASVRVEVFGEFGGKGEPAQNIRYRATVASNASKEAILELMRFTDSVAEIHNTLRPGRAVTLEACEVIEMHPAAESSAR